MATSHSWEPAGEPKPTATQVRPGYSTSHQETAPSGNGADGKRGQVLGNVRKVWQRVQDRIGLEDHQPSSSLNQDLRQGQQEARGIGRDIADIAQDLQKLVQQEVLLAQAELEEQVRRSTRAAAFGILAFIFLLVNFVFLGAAGMFALALVLPLWLSALITAGALLILMAVAGLIALWQLRQIQVVPQQTVESVKENIRWLSDQLRSSRT